MDSQLPDIGSLGSQESEYPRSKSGKNANPSMSPATRFVRDSFFKGRFLDLGDTPKLDVFTDRASAENHELIGNPNDVSAGCGSIGLRNKIRAEARFAQ
jgi:hypothetical protein